MKAVQLDAHGPAENFRIVEVPIPEPSSNEVLVKTGLAGILFADTQMRRGDYVHIPPLPFIAGREVAGEVVEVGENVRFFRPGMRVMAHMQSGGYAEYAKAIEARVVHLPDKVSYEQGLVYHNNLRIAYLNYYLFGKVQPHETILVHAAAGGIGGLLTQIAKRRANNLVIALASTDEKLEVCRRHGADHLINYKKQDYVEEVLRITGGRGVDISFNSVGGPTLKTDPLVIKPLGRWSIYGYAAGKQLLDPYPDIMPRSLTLIINSVYTVRERVEYLQATDFLRHWLETEPLDSISKTFPLEKVVEATHWLEEQKSIGKIALKP